MVGANECGCYGAKVEDEPACLLVFIAGWDGKTKYNIIAYFVFVLEREVPLWIDVFTPSNCLKAVHSI